MKVKLEELFDVVSLPLTKTAENETEYRLISPASIEKNKIKNLFFADFIRNSKINDKYFAKREDILFQIKGNKINSVYVEEDYENTLVSYFFVILRPKKDSEVKFESKYVQWLLQTKQYTNYFEKNSGGGIMAVIKVDVIKKCEIILPSLEEQLKIVELTTNFEREKNELENYINLKEKLIEKKIFEKYGEE